jgi:hypothetical protein
LGFRVGMLGGAHERRSTWVEQIARDGEAKGARQAYKGRMDFHRSRRYVHRDK